MDSLVRSAVRTAYTMPCRCEVSNDKDGDTKQRARITSSNLFSSSSSSFSSLAATTASAALPAGGYTKRFKATMLPLPPVGMPMSEPPPSPPSAKTVRETCTCSGFAAPAIDRIIDNLQGVAEGQELMEALGQQRCTNCGHSLSHHRAFTNEETAQRAARRAIEPELVTAGAGQALACAMILGSSGSVSGICSIGNGDGNDSNCASSCNSGAGGNDARSRLIFALQYGSSCAGASGSTTTASVVVEAHSSGTFQLTHEAGSAASEAAAVAVVAPPPHKRTAIASLPCAQEAFDILTKAAASTSSASFASSRAALPELAAGQVADTAAAAAAPTKTITQNATCWSVGRAVSGDDGGGGYREMGLLAVGTASGQVTITVIRPNFGLSSSSGSDDGAEFLLEWEWHGETPDAVTCLAWQAISPGGNSRKPCDGAASSPNAPSSSSTLLLACAHRSGRVRLALVDLGTATPSVDEVARTPNSMVLPPFCCISVGADGLVAGGTRTGRAVVLRLEDEYLVPAHQCALEYGAVLCVHLLEGPFAGNTMTKPTKNPTASTVALLTPPLLCYGGGDDSVCVTALSPSSPAIVLRGHSAFVSALAHCPRRGLVFSGGWDGRVCVWNLNNVALVAGASFDMARDSDDNKKQDNRTGAVLQMAFDTGIDVIDALEMTHTGHLLVTGSHGRRGVAALYRLPLSSIL